VLNVLYKLASQKCGASSKQSPVFLQVSSINVFLFSEIFIKPFTQSLAVMVGLCGI
jgi:hypothetical protein